MKNKKLITGWVIVGILVLVIIGTFVREKTYIKSYFQKPVNIMDSATWADLESGMHVEMEIDYMKEAFHEEKRKSYSRGRFSDTLTMRIYTVPYIEQVGDEYLTTTFMGVDTNRYKEFDDALQAGNSKYPIKVEGYLREMTAQEKDNLINKYMAYMNRESAEKKIVPYVICDYSKKNYFLALVFVEFLVLFCKIKGQMVLYKEGAETVEKKNSRSTRKLRTGNYKIRFTKNYRSTLWFFFMSFLTIEVVTVAPIRHIKEVVIVFSFLWGTIALIFLVAYLSALFPKFVYHEEQHSLVQNKILGVKKRFNLELAMSACVEKAGSSPKQKNLVMYIYFADSTKLRIDKSPLDNLGLIYDLFEKYDITYEENEDWKTFRDWVFDAEPGADRYFETKHEESSEEVLKKGTNIICKICGMSNKGTDKICSFCRAVLDENRP